MKDITEKLLNRMEWWRDDCEDLREAIIEIEKLREELNAITIRYSESIYEQDGLRAENSRLGEIISAADKGSPVYEAVKRILDEKSTWVAPPNDEVTKAIALAAGIAWSIHFPTEVTVSMNRLFADIKMMSDLLREAHVRMTEKGLWLNLRTRIGVVLGDHHG